MFISFDGVDGVGKSTQTELFVEWLREQGRTVVTCRDPGSTELGERLRTLVLKASEIKIDAESEMLLYMAARAQLVAEVIQPALAAGQVVVSDRFLLANVVYQGHAAGLDPQSIWDVGN
ncbi:MAG: dTMP kinase, partial [Pirellulaceae bacterium]